MQYRFNAIIAVNNVAGDFLFAFMSKLFIDKTGMFFF